MIINKKNRGRIQKSILPLFFFFLFLIPLVVSNSNVVDLKSNIQNYFLEVSKGTIAGTSAINKFGSNADVGTAYETIWDGGGAYVFPTVAQILNITSTDTDDNSAGTGARTINIQGLDANYNVVTEDLIMNGQTHVPTTNSYLRVFRMKVLTHGTSEVNEGTIYIFNGTSSTGTPSESEAVVAEITALNGQTLMSIYTIPAGKTGYMFSTYVASAGSKFVTFQLFNHPFGGANNVKFHIELTNSDVNHQWKTPLKITEKTDIWTQAKIVTGTTRVSSGFDIVLVDN